MLHIIYYNGYLRNYLILKNNIFFKTNHVIIIHNIFIKLITSLEQ
jgi:hypothetical protein